MLNANKKFTQIRTTLLIINIFTYYQSLHGNLVDHHKNNAPRMSGPPTPCLSTRDAQKAFSSSYSQIWLESFCKEFFTWMINSDNIRVNKHPPLNFWLRRLSSPSIYPAEWGSLFLNTIVHFSETLPPLSNPPTNGWGKQRGAYITSSEVPQSNTKKWDRVFLAIYIFYILWLFRFVIHSYNLLFQIAFSWPKNG